jgi:hypothetical protein
LNKFLGGVEPGAELQQERVLRDQSQDAGLEISNLKFAHNDEEVESELLEPELDTEVLHLAVLHSL